MKKAKPDRSFALNYRMTSVKVYSLANGKFRVEPYWKRDFKVPGLFTRLAAAQRLSTLINDHLKGQG